MPPSYAGKQTISGRDNYSVTVITKKESFSPGENFGFQLEIKVPDKNWASFVPPSAAPGSPLWYGVFSEATFSLRCKTKNSTKLLQFLRIFVNHNTPGSRTDKLSTFQRLKTSNKNIATQINEGDTFQGKVEVSKNCQNLEFRFDGFNTGAVTGDGENPYTGKNEQRDFYNKVLLEIVGKEIEIARASSKASSISANSPIKSGTECKVLGQKKTSNGSKYECISGEKKFYWKNISEKSTPNKKSPSPTPSAKSPLTSSCNPDKARAIGTLGSKNYQGDLLSALIIENVSNCNLLASVSVTFLCPSGGALQASNWVISSTTVSLKPLEKLAIASVEVQRYFVTIKEQCFRLTNTAANSFWVSENAPINVRIISAN